MLLGVNFIPSNEYSYINLTVVLSAAGCPLAPLPLNTIRGFPRLATFSETDMSHPSICPYLSGQQLVTTTPTLQAKKNYRKAYTEKCTLNHDKSVSKQYSSNQLTRELIIHVVSYKKRTLCQSLQDYSLLAFKSSGMALPGGNIPIFGILVSLCIYFNICSLLQSSNSG